MQEQGGKVLQTLLTKRKALDLMTVHQTQCDRR